MAEGSPDGIEKTRRASKTAVDAGLASEEDAATLGEHRANELPSN